MRWGILGATLLLAASACGDDGAGGDEASTETGTAEPVPDPAMERRPVDVPLERPLHAVGDTVLGFGERPPGEDSPANLVRSTDLGRSWETVSRPDRPADPGFSYGSLQVIDGLAVVSGKVATDDTLAPVEASYVWTSRDGREWQGGELPLSRPASPLATPVVRPTRDGSTVVGMGTIFGDPPADQGVEMVRSDGDGWTGADTPEVGHRRPRPGLDSRHLVHRRRSAGHGRAHHHQR